MTTLRIAVDAMGGDLGWQATFPAVIQQASVQPSIEFIIFGNQNDYCIEQPLPDNVTCVHVEQQIKMTDVPTQALRHGRQSSMGMALQAVKSARADACITAGNTGALVALARHILGVHDSIDRPALCKMMPTHLGCSYMLDLGATINCSAKQLVDFARLGAALHEYAGSGAINKKVPTVRLLNIGSEHFKGMDPIRDAGIQLQTMKSLDYEGFIEGDAIYRGVADIIVCDGFVGNIALKTSEGVARYMVDSLRSALNNSDTSSTWNNNGNNKKDSSTLQNSFCKSVMVEWQTTCDPGQYNGAYLLGVKGTVIKSHGGVGGTEFSYALKMLIDQLQQKNTANFADILQSYAH